MNAALVAAALRQLADAIEADETAEEQPRARRLRSMPRPAGEAPAAVAGRAAKILRERGYR